MSKSKLVKINDKIAEGVTDGYKKIENAVTEGYKKIEDGMAAHELLEAVARSRGFILQGGVMDTERAARIVLDEYRAGKIARVTLDSARMPCEEAPDGQAE